MLRSTSPHRRNWGRCVHRYHDNRRHCWLGIIHETFNQWSRGTNGHVSDWISLGLRCVYPYLYRELTIRARMRTSHTHTIHLSHNAHNTTTHNIPPTHITQHTTTHITHHTSHNHTSHNTHHTTHNHTHHTTTHNHTCHTTQSHITTITDGWPGQCWCQWGREGPGHDQTVWRGIWPFTVRHGIAAVSLLPSCELPHPSLSLPSPPSLLFPGMPRWPPSLRGEFPLAFSRMPLPPATPAFDVDRGDTGSNSVLPTGWGVT